MKAVSASLAIITLAAFFSSARAQSPAANPTPNPLGDLPAPQKYSVGQLPPVGDITPPPAPASSTAPVLSASPTPAAAPSPTPAPSPVAQPSPTPLPDGTMPLPVPPLPTPALPDASTLSEELNLPIPTPDQQSEPLKPSGEASELKSSDQMAMQQKMVLSTFEKSLEGLIAKQRNPKVPDMKISDAVQIALRQNPNLLNAIQQIRLTRGQLIQVVSQAVPQIRISSSYNQVASPLNSANQQIEMSGSQKVIIPNPSGGKPIVLDLGSSEKDVQNQTWNISFTGSQLIFDGGQTTSAIKAGSAAYDAAFFSLRSTIDQLVALVTQQFYQVVLNRALIVAQQQNVALLEQQVKDQQNRYEAGTVPRFNVLQAEVQLANAKPPLIQAENAYRISLYQFVQTLGMDYPPGYPSEVPFNIVGSLGYSPQNVNPDDSIRVAIARNPALKAQRQGILTQAANVSSQIGGYFPTINATAGYTVENNAFSPNLGDNFTGWFFGATGNWNFWDGGLTYGNVAQAKAQLMQSKNNYDNGVRQVVLDVQQSISNLTQARQTIDATTASVVQATEALRLSRERLDAGAGTQLDVLNAQVQLLQAQTNVLQARYDYISARASYEQALSIDTQYVELFDDPLVRPLNPQALTKAETRKFDKITSPDRKQPELPRKFRKEDPIKPILEAAPSPSPKPKKGKSQGINK